MLFIVSPYETGFFSSLLCIKLCKAKKNLIVLTIKELKNVRYKNNEVSARTIRRRA